MSKINKQIYRIFTISALGSFRIAGASWVALLAARGFSLVEIGLAESCFHIASFLFEIPSGVISDVFGRKRSMILSQCMNLLSSVLMIFSRNIIDVCIAMGICAFGYNFASGSREALAYDTLKSEGLEEHYIKYSSREYTIYAIGNAAATLCAGLALYLGYQKANAVDALLGILCLIVSLGLKEIKLEKDQFKGEIRTRILTCFKESISFLTHNHRAIALMLWNGLIGAASILTIFFLQARLQTAGLPHALLGPALFFVSLGNALGATLSEKTTSWSYQKSSVFCILGVLGGVIASLSGIPIVMCLGGFLSGMCDNLIQVKSDALLNEQFPSSQRATLVSVSSLCFSVIMILLSPAAGYLFS